MRIALIQAGGIGVRIGENIPKQFIEVNGKPIIISTLEKFQNSEHIDGIYIACVENWKKELTQMCNLFKISKVLDIVTGGDSAYTSTRNCLMRIKQFYRDDTLIMIHEAVRPLVTNGMIKDSIKIAELYGNSVASYKCIDEVELIKNEKVIFDDELFTLINPHTFYLGDLCELYSSPNIETKYQGTAVMANNAGKKLYLSSGHPDCFKITYPDDIKRFAALQKIYE